MTRHLSKQAVCVLLLTAPLFAFTYQGRLYDNGDPVQGSYNMYFTVYDASAAGNAVTSAYSVPGVSITNGYFTVNLNFPAESVFNGQARWLEIAMRKSGTADPLQTLSPRYSLSSVPYADRAQSAQQLCPLAFITDHIVKMQITGEPDRYFHYFNAFEQKVNAIQGPTMRMPGQPSVSDIELRGFADRDTSLFDWIRRLETTKIRKTVRLSVLNRKGIIQEQWLFTDCVPIRVQYDYDPALAAVIQTIVLKAEFASRPAETIGRFANEWFPGPQPVIKGPFVITPEGMPAQLFDAFSSLGLQADFLLSNPGDPFPIITVKVTPLDPVFLRDAQNNSNMTAWFESILYGNPQYKTVAFSLTTDEHPYLRGNLSQSWPNNVKSYFDPLTKKTKESIRIVAQGMDLE